MVRVVDQCLEVPLQVGPAPLQASLLPIHFRRSHITTPSNCSVSSSVSTVAARVMRSENTVNDLATQVHNQAFAGPSFVGCVDRQQSGSKLRGGLLVGRTQGGRRLVLQLHDPSWRTGLPQHLFQKQAHPPLRLSKTTHQEHHQGDQLRTGLTSRNTRRQIGTRRDPACGAQQTMKLIFRHERSISGDFPDLMPPRLGVISCQPVPTAATGRRLERHHLAAFLGGNQGPLVFGMTRLATAFLPGSAAGGPWRRGLGMRMLRTGRKRRILRRLAEPHYQFLDAPSSWAIR